MNYASGHCNALRASLYVEAARYRHRVFVEKLGWELQCQGDLEFDQFDRDDTVYVVAHSASGDIAGTARLLPTTRPYLLSEVFPQLFHGHALPSSADVWELSRFAAVDFTARACGATPLKQFSSPIAVGLLRATLACAAEHGAKRVVTVSPLGVERLLRKAGFRARRAGPPLMIGDKPVFACWIET